MTNRGNQAGGRDYPSGARPLGPGVACWLATASGAAPSTWPVPRAAVVCGVPSWVAPDASRSARRARILFVAHHATSPTSATISATGGGSSATASMTVTPSSSSGTTDTVKVTRAEYVVSDQVLNVQATSTSSTATLKAFVTSSGALIGTLQNKGGGQYQGQFELGSNPQNVTIKSSLGGSASLAVTAK